MTEGPLSNVRVLDLTDERAIYGVKLIADLGADVVRPEPPEGDPLRQRGPHVDGNEKNASLWHAFFASNRRFFALDVDAPEGREQLAALIDRADIVIVTGGTFAAQAANLAEARTRHPALVVVEASSFGEQGPWKDYLAPDLVAGALGGAVATTGDADTPPIKTFGELNFMVSGAYVAIAALTALYHARDTGEGQRVHVPVHQCIASCIEQVFMWYWYHHILPMAKGPVLERQGSLHWSNAYVVMPAKNGSIMVTPTPDIDSQLVWLIENGMGEELLDPKYQEIEHRPEFIARLMGLLRDWVATRDVEELFFEAQERHSPYGWVLPLNKLAENPQLESRDWWVDYRIDGRKIRGPGMPYHFSETPWQMGAHGGIGTDTQTVLKDIGWEGRA